MKNITMLQEPGFLMDLYYAFYLKFNYKNIIDNNPNNKASEEFLKHSKEVLQLFGEIPEDLYIFFRPVGDENVTFLFSCYLKNFEKDFKENYTVQSLQREFTDFKKVIKNVISFFFQDIDVNALDACEDSKEKLFKYVKESDYSMEEKIKLYEFFIDPIYYINLFQQTLIDKCSVLSAYYKEHYKTIIDAYDPLFIYEISDSLKYDTEEREGYVTFCLLDKYHFELFNCDNSFLYILGVDYKNNKYMVKDGADASLLENFCYALCEKNRINILMLLLEKNELTCKELERHFDISGSTAYHHISLMHRMGILKTRNEGKNMYYSINTKTFNQIIILLKRFKRYKEQ